MNERRKYHGNDVRIGVTVAVLVIGMIMDVRCYRIRNWLIVVGMMAGGLLVVSSIGDGSVLHLGNVDGPGFQTGIVTEMISRSNWKEYLLGLLVPFLIGWIPWRIGAIGAGDVKLFMVIGCLNGSDDAMYCIFFAFLLAAGISISRLLILGQFKVSLTSSFLYFQQILMQRRIEMYAGRQDQNHLIHFSIPIFLGYVLWMGVKLWEIKPFY